MVCCSKFLIRIVSSRSVCFSIIVLLLIPPGRCPAQVVINEVYYDHPGSDAGHEFVELINTGGLTVAIADLSLQFHNGSSNDWVPVWSGQAPDSLEPGALYLIGGPLVFPAPDEVVELGLQNGAEALKLLERGMQVDMAAYGDLDDPAFCEGTSAGGVEPGSSLGRIPDGRDTGDNSVDFHVLVPSPGSFNSPHRNAGPFVPAPLRRTLEPIETFTIHFGMINLGSEDLPAKEAVAALYDSSSHGGTLLASFTNDAPLTPGETMTIERSFLLEEGYHFLSVVTSLSGDERPADDTLSIVVRCGAPALVVSEVMSYPSVDCVQYVELFNGGDNEVDIERWRLRDSSHAPTLVTDIPVVLAPGDYLVLTGDKGALLDCFPGLDGARVLAVAGTWPYLNHTGSGPSADSLLVYDFAGLLVDGISYPPQRSGERGRSLERVDIYPGGGDHVWVLSEGTGGGTPGKPNGIALAKPPRTGRVNASPNPFELGAERMVIEVPRRDGAVQVTVDIFDLEGARVRRLGSAGVLPCVFVWDGRDDGGEPVRPGMYILACVYRCEGCAGGSVERVVVGCGEKKMR